MSGNDGLLDTIAGLEWVLFAAGAETPAPKTSRDLTRDTTFGWHTWSWARLQEKTGKSKVFLYYFDEHPEYPPDSQQRNLKSKESS